MATRPNCHLTNDTPCGIIGVRDRGTAMGCVVGRVQQMATSPPIAIVDDISPFASGPQFHAIVVASVGVEAEGQTQGGFYVH